MNNVTKSNHEGRIKTGISFLLIKELTEIKEIPRYIYIHMKYKKNCSYKIHVAVSHERNLYVKF